MNLLFAIASGLFDLLTGIAFLDMLFGHDEPEARKRAVPVKVVGRRRRI